MDVKSKVFVWVCTQEGNLVDLVREKNNKSDNKVSVRSDRAHIKRNEKAVFKSTVREYNLYLI